MNPSFPKRDRSTSSQRHEPTQRPYKLPKVMPETKYSSNSKIPSLLTLDANTINIPPNLQIIPDPAMTDQNRTTTPQTKPDPTQDAASRAAMVAVLDAARTIVQSTSLCGGLVPTFYAPTGPPAAVVAGATTKPPSRYSSQVSEKHRSSRNARLASKSKNQEIFP